MIELTAAKDDDGRRLDRILRKALPELSLSLIHRLLRQKKILVDDKPATPNHLIKQGMIIKVYASVNHTCEQVNKNIVNQEKIEVNKKSLSSPDPRPQTLIPILWQGSGIIAFNKPVGLSTHGANSLDSIVNDWLRPALPRSLSFKPGPLHRLDKPTSGIIIFSQTLEGAKQFSKLLRERKLEKIYLAIVEGRMEKEQTWQDPLTHDKETRKTYVKNEDTPTAHAKAFAPISSNSGHSLGSRTVASIQVPRLTRGVSCAPAPRPQTPDPSPAVTLVTPIATNNKYTLIEARIKTGRHHQIRAQAASHGHPLANDIKYGGKPMPGQTKGGKFFLHAWKIKFNEKPEGFPREIIAPIPEEFQLQIKALFRIYHEPH